MHFVLSVYDHVQDHVDADVVLDVEGFLIHCEFQQIQRVEPHAKAYAGMSISG